MFELVNICLLATVALYFYNNPMKHGRWFMTRRFINWFPLGMTYAFLYMGRYNLIVSKNAFGSLMTKEEFGWIFAIGTWAYALSFLVNGPLIDTKLGGKRGMLIAAGGSALANVLMGLVTWLVLTGRLEMRLAGIFSVLYALNMYFQSFGAVSIIKVKAYWFHVRERGVFGAIFGTLISIGVYFAYDWGDAVVQMTKSTATAPTGWLHGAVRQLFVPQGSMVDATWAVFFIPAAILLAWVAIDLWLIRDTPEEAGFEHFDTHDASSGEMHVELSTADLLGRVFRNPLMLMIASVELTSGVLRNGVMQWYKVFAHEVPQPGARFVIDNWGGLLCLFGIAGGFLGGLLSDKLFQSRRGPPAALLCCFMFVLTLLMTAYLFTSPPLVAAAALLISMAVIGVHSLMSGTAAADFGGRKATATCSGIVDGFVYLGSGLQSVSLGYLVGKSWLWWPAFLAPFALLGAFIAVRIWHELPAATRKYLKGTEAKGAVSPAGAS
ncbi:MAG: MFS transporter [Candidatus Riflebacteria bacterium]|nr:MFS transporter [Candidatus Riflebacteria bacterium]